MRSDSRVFLPRVNGAGHSVVTVVHHVRSPAVAPHALRAVVPGHSQVLGEQGKKKKKKKRADNRGKCVEERGDL